MITNIRSRLATYVLSIIWFFILLFFALDPLFLKLEFSFKLFIITISLGLMTIIAAKGFKYRKELIIPIIVTILVGCGFLITGIINATLGYIAYAVLFILILPLFFVRNNNYQMLINALITAGISFNFLFICVSFLVAPLYGGIQYSSFVANANTLGIFLTFFFICLFYQLIYSPCKKKGVKVLVIFDLVMNVAFLVLSESRTALLAFLYISIIYITFLIKSKRISVKRCMLFILAVVVSFTFSLYFLSNITPVGNLEFCVKAQEEYEIRLDNRLQSFSKKLLKGIGTDGRFTSGRVEIWTAFSKELDFIGHENETMIIENEIDGIQERDAHNSVLQIWFSAGAISGIAYFGLIIIMLIISIKNLIKYTKDIYSVESNNMIYVMMVGSYFICSMLGSMYSPTHSILSFCMWLFVPLFYINVDREENNEHIC